jgi:hypothetical protein
MGVPIKAEKKMSNKIEQLRALEKSINQKHDFKTGDVVTWKSGLKNKKSPEYGNPAIVTRVLPIPIADKDRSGSPYFNEPLDIVIGILDEDGDFLEYHADSRRFELIEITE